MTWVGFTDTMQSPKLIQWAGFLSPRAAEALGNSHKTPDTGWPVTGQLSRSESCISEAHLVMGTHGKIHTRLAFQLPAIFLLVPPPSHHPRWTHGKLQGRSFSSHWCSANHSACLGIGQACVVWTADGSEEEKSRSTVTCLSGLIWTLGWGKIEKEEVAKIKRHLGRAVLNLPLAVRALHFSRDITGNTKGSGTERKLRRGGMFLVVLSNTEKIRNSSPSLNVTGAQSFGHLVASGWKWTSLDSLDRGVSICITDKVQPSFKFSKEGCKEARPDQQMQSAHTAKAPHGSSERQVGPFLEWRR